MNFFADVVVFCRLVQLSHNGVAHPIKDRFICGPVKL